jgi:hypothetical protein
MRTKLADPDYEPTDAELRELSRAAFSEVAARHQAALAKVYDEIAALRAKHDLKSQTPKS